MIQNETFRAYLAEKIGITLYADRGEFEAAYRNHNEVIAPVCGVFRMTPMSITPVQGLFLATANASVEIAADRTTLAEVRATIDNLAANASGETLPITDDEGRTYIVTISYSTAYVGLERTAPNNIGEVIPVTMTVHYTIIENGVSANDVRMRLDGHPIFVTEFSVSNQRVADSYTIDKGMTSAVVTQGVRSFDFISPLLSNELGRIYRRAIWKDDENTAHCFTMEMPGEGDEKEIYPYIVIFGNVSASGQQPQNIGCNISLLEGTPEILAFGEGWEAVESVSGSHTLTAPETPARKMVFWGDGKSEAWETKNGDLTHEYEGDGTYTLRIFTEEIYEVKIEPSATYKFYADADMTVTLYGNDVTDSGFWRRSCTIDWGDGTSAEYDTTLATFEDLPQGISHTYEQVGLYQIKVYDKDEPIFVYGQE